MISLDTVSLAILLGAALIMAGILSSLLALRFGAPLLLVFLLIGLAAGESGPGGLKFDDVRTTYMVGSIALALILFDGGLRTRFSSIRTVLSPSLMLATVGVLATALLTAPIARYALDISWTSALLVGAVIASTDAAAVFLLVHAQGLRLRPRVGATLEVESGTNDPFAVFLTLILVELLSVGDGSVHPWQVSAGIRPRRLRRRDRRLDRGDPAQPRRVAAGIACALRDDRGARGVRRRPDLSRVGISRGLCRRHDHRQSADAGAQLGGHVPRCGDLAGPDRDVRDAGPSGLACSPACCRRWRSPSC